MRGQRAPATLAPSSLVRPPPERQCGLVFTFLTQSEAFRGRRQQDASECRERVHAINSTFVPDFGACAMGRTRWHLVSNHGAALIYLAARPTATIREVSVALGVSHRRTAGIVRELADAGMLVIQKHGSRNHYVVDCSSLFPHPFLSHLPVGLMLKPVVEALASAQPSGSATGA